MKVDSHKLGLVGAAASAIFFTGFSLLMSFVPEKMIDLMASMHFVRSAGALTGSFGVDAQIFVIGLVQYALYSYIYFYLLGYMYNYLGKKR